MDCSTPNIRQYIFLLYCSFKLISHGLPFFGQNLFIAQCSILNCAPLYGSSFSLVVSNNEVTKHEGVNDLEQSCQFSNTTAFIILCYTVEQQQNYNSYLSINHLLMYVKKKTIKYLIFDIGWIHCHFKINLTCLLYYIHLLTTS